MTQALPSDRLLPQQNLYYESVNLLGTAGPWRPDAIAALEQEGVWPTGWYDPMIPRDEGPRPGNIYVETYRLATNRYDATHVEPGNRALITEIELGHAMVKAVLGGTEPYMQLNDFTGNDETALRARKLVTTAVEQMRTLLPADAFRVADPTLPPAEQQHRLHEWLHTVGARIVAAQQSGKEWTAITPALLEAQPLGQPQVFLSGTSVATSAAKRAFNDEAARRGLLVVDSYTGPGFDEADMTAEYEALMASQVAAVMITNDTETIAGTAEATIRAALAAMNLNRLDADGVPRQQAFGLFVEEPDETRLTPYAVELRRALLLHVKAIQKRFPHAIYLAKSPQELAVWAHRSITR